MESRARARLTTRAMRRCSAAPALALTAAALRRGAALGEHHAVHACAVGHAQQRAQVLRVLDSIKGEDEAGRAFEFDFGWIGDKKIFDGEQLLRADKRDDALMGGRLGELVNCSRGCCWTRTPAWRQAETRRSRRPSRFGARGRGGRDRSGGARL